MILAVILLAHAFYDPECCGGSDCAPITEKSVIEASDGYHVEGMLVPYADPRIRLSPDDQYHLCAPHYRNAKLRCLYVPKRLI